jgi:hypothetical protein
MNRFARGWLFSAVLFLLLIPGCVGRYVRLEQKGMTCVEAHQIALVTVQRLGYSVVEATKPAPGSPGIVTGAKGSGSQSRKVLVQVFCTELGAEVEARAEGEGMPDLGFAREFQKGFTALSAQRPRPRELTQSGVDVAVHLERANANELGVDLSSLAVVLANVRIANHTNRAYWLRMSRIVLQDEAGKRTPPLAPSEVLTKVAPEVRDALAPRLLRDRLIQPHDQVEGYAFFPFGAYSRARVSLQDAENEEIEGFAIEF